jgi:hypothetical protein
VRARAALATLGIQSTNTNLSMSFYQEPLHYEKTILSELQGAWILLREAVVTEHESKDCSQLLLHIDEAMSWESVRNIQHMKNTFVLIQSIAQQINISDETIELMKDVRDILYDLLDEIKTGKVL